MKIIYKPNKLVNKKIIFETVKSSRNIDESLEKICLEEWKEKKVESEKNGIKIWDSSTYRFEKIKERDNDVLIQISTIPFSIRLMMNQHTDQINSLGLDYAPLGIFTSCFVITTDNKYVFVKKSKKLHFDRRYGFIGGLFSEDDQKDNSYIDIYEDLKREIKEEIGLDSSLLNNIQLLSFYQNEKLNCCFLFKVHVDIKSSEIKKIFTTKHDEEIDSLIFLSDKNINNFFKENFHTKDIVKLKFLKS